MFRVKGFSDAAETLGAAQSCSDSESIQWRFVDDLRNLEKTPCKHQLAAAAAAAGVFCHLWAVASV